MSASEDEASCAVLRRALALSRARFQGDLHALIGEAVDRVGGTEPPGVVSLRVLRAVQETLSAGAPFGDPGVWAARASAEELRAVLEATLLRLRGHG